jgi:outer membrane protein assembly factor BamB
MLALRTDRHAEMLDTQTMSFASRVLGRIGRAETGAAWAIAVLALGGTLGFAGGAHGAIPSWTTYHHDAARSGIDPESTSPAPPAKLWNTDLDGGVWAEPLVYGSYVYVATQNDTIYAIDAATGTVHWRAQLGTPVPGGELPCGDIAPTVGITSTPVIDPQTNTIYAVTDTWEGTRASIRHELVALDLSTGAMRANFPREADPPYPAGGAARNQLQRAALALDGSEVVIGYGGNDGDCETYWGWLVGSSESGTGPLRTYQVDSGPGHEKGAIWGSGNAPAIDSSGNLYTATGNGCCNSEYDFGESVLKLNGNLELLESWAPANWQEREEKDLDLGSSNPLLLPDGKVFQVSKTGNEASLLYGSALGGVGGATASTFEACPGSGSWGGGIYVPTSADGGTLYVNCDDGLHAVSVSELGSPHPKVSDPAGWHVDGNAVGPPIFAGGLVWVASWTSGTLYGLDPANGEVAFEEALGGFEHFATPSAGGGRLFVANDDHLTAFGIAITPAPSPTATALSSSANPATEGSSMTFSATVSPAPDGGAVAFTDDGAAIRGCEHVTLVPASHGKASCRTALATAGAHTIVAAYSGDAYYAASTSSPLVQVVHSVALARLALYGAKESHTRWREGNALARISALGGWHSAGAAAVKRPRRKRLPVGDTFSFTLSRTASVRFAFTQSAPGRRVGNRCVAPGTHRGKTRRRVAGCTRHVIAGTLTFSGRAGVNTVQFEGRISHKRRLSAGRYTLVISASAAGQSSPPQRLQFTIVGSQRRRGAAAMLAGLARHSASSSSSAGSPDAETGTSGLRSMPLPVGEVLAGPRSW